MKWILSLCGLLSLGIPASRAADTLPPLVDGKAPRTFDELWAGYDPRAEPLDVEVVKAWEEDGVVCRVVRYRIGVFKGQKALMLGVYGYPKSVVSRQWSAGRRQPGTDNGQRTTDKLPGLVQIHGGGQSANLNAVLANARRGYACISLNWLCNPVGVPGYSGPNTDWGAVDATQNKHNSHFNSFAPDALTVDAVPSPRNSNWFLGAIAVRRALTFLEQQPEVDGTKLGVYGHSMGAYLTVMTAGSDPRVKVAAPSCGGFAGEPKQAETLEGRTIGLGAYLPRIRCPILFLIPANDFAGPIQFLPDSAGMLRNVDCRFTCVPHLNHRDQPEHYAAGLLWFDQHLKGGPALPRTPEAQLALAGPTGCPRLTVTPDPATTGREVMVYYTQQGSDPETRTRYWRTASVKQQGNGYVADLPLFSVEQPLWVYANVRYPLPTPVKGAGYYYGSYTANSVALSSVLKMVTPEELTAAGVRATLAPTLLIEDFSPGWEKGWFVHDDSGAGKWPYRTNRLHDPQFAPPAWAKLALEVRAEKTNTLVLNVDDYAAEVKVNGGPDWQTITLFPLDFHKGDGSTFLKWRACGEFVLGGKADWQGPVPEFRNLRWVPGTREELDARRVCRLAKIPPVEGKTYLDYHYADYFTSYRSAMNTTLEGAPLVVNGVTYAHGITAHAVSEAVFFLNGGYQRFHTLAWAAPRSSVAFQVYLDDKLAFDSKLMGGDRTVPIDLPVAGARELRLCVTDGGNGIGGDLAAWLDAYVGNEQP
jgi:pimeloyl-ACP methyl ester carboxylesterase